MNQFGADNKDTSYLNLWEEFEYGLNVKPATKKERDGEDMPEGEKPDMPECASDDETCEKPEDMPECSSDDETCEKPERKGGNGGTEAEDATTDG